MATLRPKSPRPVAIKGEKDESIWDKIGTLGRKKKLKEGKYYFRNFYFSGNVKLLYLVMIVTFWLGVVVKHLSNFFDLFFSSRSTS